MGAEPSVHRRECPWGVCVSLVFVSLCSAAKMDQSHKHGCANMLSSQIIILIYSSGRKEFNAIIIVKHEIIMCGVEINL